MRGVFQGSTRWRDVAFAMLLCGLSSYAFYRDYEKSSNYAVFYESYCRRNWQQYRARVDADLQWRSTEEVNFRKANESVAEKNRMAIASLRREGDDKCLQLREKSSAMMSIKEHLEKNYGPIHRISESETAKIAPLVKVSVVGSEVRVSYLEPTESRTYRITFFSQQGLITGELTLPIKPTWGIFGGRPGSVKEHTGVCHMRNGDPVYCAVRIDGEV